MRGKARRLGVYNVIPKPDAWAWKTKQILEHPNSDKMSWWLPVVMRVGRTNGVRSGINGARYNARN